MTKFRFLAPFAILSLVLTACPAGDGGAASPGDGGGAAEGDGSIIVTSLWGGAEEEAFTAVLAAFTEETGITAEYEANRTDYSTVLRTRIQGGNPPDVAIIPGIGFLRSFARGGSIIPLEDLGINRADIEGNYPPGLLDVGVVDGVLYAPMVKLNSKATIWYDPSRFSDLGVEPADSWEGLVTLSEDIAGGGATPWSVAGGDGWTLTDWFEATYLKDHGVDAYKTLFSPDGDWTGEDVKASITRLFDELLTEDNVDGGTDGALATAFVDGIAKVFSTGASAEMYCCGAFVGGIAASADVNPDLTYGTDIDWFAFPTIEGGAGGIGDISYGGDVMAALVNDSDVAAFMEYLTSTASGQVWAEGGTIVSPLKAVDVSVYPESVQKEAEQIYGATALVFDGSDLLPAGPDLGALLQSAFRGEDIGPLLDDFQAAVTTAWEEE